MNAVHFMSARCPAVMATDRKTASYRLGIAQLAEWHAQCRAKRLGIARENKDVTTWRVEHERRQNLKKKGSK